MRSRCHHRPLNRQASVGACSGCAITVGRGHSASIAAAIAAASSSLGAGVIEIAATVRPYRTRLLAVRRRQLFLIARVFTIMSWNVRFSESHSGHRNPR